MTFLARFEHLELERQRRSAGDADQLIRGSRRTYDLKQSAFAAPRAWRSGACGINLRQRSDLIAELAHAHGLRLERGVALAADVVKATRRAAGINDVR